MKVSAGDSVLSRGGRAARAEATWTWSSGGTDRGTRKEAVWC